MPSGVTALSIGWDQLSTTTGRTMLPKMADNIFNSNRLSEILRAKQSFQDGGAYLVQGLIYGEGPGGFYTAKDVLDFSEAEVATAAVFFWKQMYTVATLDGLDGLKNSGKAAFANLLTVKMQVAEKTGANWMGVGLHSDGVNHKYITGLRAAVTGSGTTYGNISKTTNSWWRAQVDSTTVLTGLTDDVMGTQIEAATEGNERPDMGLTNKTIYRKIVSLYQPQQRFMDGPTARAGFKNVIVQEIPVHIDSHCPAGYLYWLNTNHLNLVTHSARNMTSPGWVKPWNQDIRAYPVFWAGNLTCSNCRFQAVHTVLV